MQILSLSPEFLDGEGGTSQILFHFLCDAWSSWKGGIKQIKKHGIPEEDLLETDKLITESGISAAQKHPLPRGVGGHPGGTELDLSQVPPAGSALQLGAGWEGAPRLCGQDDLAGMSTEGTGSTAGSRQPHAARSPEVLPKQLQVTAGSGTSAERPCAGRATTGARGHRTCSERQSWVCGCCSREDGGKAEITYPSGKYLPAEGRSLHEAQKLQECDALVV